MTQGLEKKTNRNKLPKQNKTKKRPKILLLSHRTPQKIVKISKEIDEEIDENASSYSPSINKELVSLKSVQRNPVFNCNISCSRYLDLLLNIFQQRLKFLLYQVFYMIQYHL